MRNLTHCLQSLGLVILVSVAMPGIAEPAPVYDADTMPQQFDNADQAQSGQDTAPVAAAPEQEVNAVPAPEMPPTSTLSTEDRLKRVEQQINNIQNSDSTSQLDSLQTQIQALRSSVEQLSHQLQVVQTEQKNTAMVKPQLIASAVAATKPAKLALNSNQATTKIVPTAQVAGQPNVAEEQQIYQTAYNQIKAKKYEDAVNTLEDMLKKYPTGQFASNAHYWLGELYGLMGKNDQALTEFSTVLKNYPDSPRVSDAQLKVGLIYASQSNWSEAKVAFKRVMGRYPGTAPARLAAEHLKQIKQAGK
jgi:tol-pal system protein YbgF